MPAAAAPHVNIDVVGCAVGGWRQARFTEVGSGSLRSRPQLDACLERLGDGDTLIVWRLDRLGRSLAQLPAVRAKLSERGLAFRSLIEAIDTTTAADRLQVHLFAALAESERSLGQERTRAGSKPRGQQAGRAAGPPC
jgi:DNA invertase Pin-like site-specific DNA recombinase